MKQFHYLTLIAITLGIATLTYALPSSAAYFLREVPHPVSTQTILNSEELNIDVTLPEGATSQKTYVKAMTYVPQGEVAHFFTPPAGLVAVSDLWLVRANGPLGTPAQLSKPLMITLDGKGRSYQELYFYNWANLQFEKAPIVSTSTDGKITIELPTHTKSLIFAFFGTEELVGTASWYVHPRYPGELITASVDFPFGTKLRVINVANNKEVIVTVKDYGPDKSVHPDRVVDLSKTAFAAIASTGAGVIKVRVIPITE